MDMFRSILGGVFGAFMRLTSRFVTMVTSRCVTNGEITMSLVTHYCRRIKRKCSEYRFKLIRCLSVRYRFKLQLN